MNLKLKAAGTHFTITVFLFVMFVVSSHTYAQLNSANFTQYTEKDGLPGVSVNKVLVDKLGQVWIGSVNGLARYDGYNFKRFYFNPNDTNTIRGLVIWSIFEDSKGLIWVASNPAYLNSFDPSTQKFRQYQFAHLVPRSKSSEHIISNICEDNNGRIYFGFDTYYGDTISTSLLYKEGNEDQLKVFKMPDSLMMLNIYRLRKDNTGNIWILSNSGLFVIDVKGEISKPVLPNVYLYEPNDWPCDIGFDIQGHAWVISLRLKLYEIDPATGNNISKHIDNLYNPTVNYYRLSKIIFDKDDNIWIGSNDGLHFFNRKTGQFSVFNSGAKKELEHMPINDICMDSFGTVWIATHVDGLVKYDEKVLMKSYSNNEENKKQLTAGWANNIYEASDGRIWITTGGSSSQSGINILNPKTGAVKIIPYSMIQNRINGVSAIWENTPGEIYLSFNNAIFSFNEKTLSLNQVSIPGISGTTITYHLKDGRGIEWAATYIGLYKKEPGATAYKKYDLSKLNTGGNVPFNNELSRVAESKKYGLWILSNNGLFLYNYTTDKIEGVGYDKTLGDIFITQDINSFYEDADGILWVGTWQGGFSKYDPVTKKIQTYTINDGLPSMSVQGILPDEKNNSLWLSTFEGLSRFNKNTGQFNNFTIADGIQGQLFADGAYLKTSGGQLYFGGSNGVTAFYPDDAVKNSIPPKVYLTDIKLSNSSILPGENSILKKPVYETSEITLEHNQNNISIEFLTLHFSNPSKNKSSYKLENYDNDWRNAGSQQEAYYSNLPPGQYIFHVKAANDKGVWNEKGASLKIFIKKPWWKTTLAYILYGVIFICLAFAADRYMRRRLVQKEREKNQARELEQAKEIEKAYYKLEETHEALKSTQSQLIQSEKMASLGELTAGIAHEIQNPLNFVNNFSEVSNELLQEMKEELTTGNLQLATELADDVIQNLQKINHHGNRASSIVKGMLEHSRTSDGKKELTDINALADEYLRLAYHGLRAKDKTFNASMKTDFDESIGNINIVPQDIGRVILNLITNAFYAVNEKKKSNNEGYEPVVSINTKKLGDKVEIKVGDNGNGIPNSVLDKIFQPFFTTKPTGSGTGLGLSLSYDIIKAHGGEIKVESKGNEGSLFAIIMPI